MKWITAILLWFAACALAVLIAYRLWRGKPIILARRHPRILRMAVFLLVALGFGANQVRPEGAGGKPSPQTPSPEEAAKTLPEILRERSIIAAWRRASGRDGIPTSFWQSLGQMAQKNEVDPETYRELTKNADAIPKQFQSILKTDLAALRQGSQHPPLKGKEILDGLDAIEKAGIVHEEVVAYLWKRLPNLADEDRSLLPEIARRLRLHSVMHNALMVASFGVKPFNPRAWMSKAGTQQEDRVTEDEAVKQILKALPVAIAKVDAGPWDRDARIRLKVQGPCQIFHQGQKQKIEKGDVLEMNRLSLLKTSEKLSVEHEWIGTVELPGDQTLSVWDLPALLPETAKKTIRETVDSALSGDEGAAERIELALPFAHEILREQLRRNPEAKDAPRLRMILALFDR